MAPRSSHKDQRGCRIQGPETAGGGGGRTLPGGGPPMVIDCDDCAVRGPGCRDCVVSVILGVPETLSSDERAALEVLAEVGLAPRLRLVPIRRERDSGVA